MKIVPTGRWFWWSKRPIETLRVLFLGWRSDAIRAAVRGSIHILMDEHAAGRRLPVNPAGFLDIRGATESEDGTPSGTDLDILFDPNKITPEEIVAYLATVGLSVE
jgi:hypothetical protein